MFNYLIALVLIFVPLYPKFPLAEVMGTFVAIRLEDILVAGVYLIWGIWAIKNKFWQKIIPSERAMIVYWLAGAIATFSGIVLTKTVEPSLGALHTLRRVEYMGMFFVAYSTLTSLGQLKFLKNTLLIVALIVALYGLGQQFLAWPVISTNNSEFSKGLALELGPGARINSTFAGHYDLAAWSLFPLLLILGEMIISSKHRLLLGSMGILVYWAMLLSASRVTFVALLSTATLLVWLLKSRRWLIVVGVFGVVGLIASPQLLGRYRELIVNGLKITYASPVYAQSAADDVPDALKPPAEPEDRSLSIRLNASWPNAIRSVIKNPILGTGFSSIGLAADNDYLRSLAETGLLGTLAFALVFVQIFRQLKEVALHPRKTSIDIFILAMGCALMALLINAVFIDIFEASKIAIVTWTLMGLSTKATTLNE